MTQYAYIVEMWLTCTDNSPSAYAAFRDRFTPVIENSWRCLSYDGDLTQAELADRLNTEIQNQMQVWIENDLHFSLNSVDAFQDNYWSEGGGGLHEAHVPVFAVPAPGPTAPPKSIWEFAYTGGGSNKPDMYAHVRWDKVVVQP